MSRRVHLIGLVALELAVLACIVGYAQGIPPGAVAVDGTLRLGPEVWFVIVSAAVTLGINLEQLRRVRSDIKDHRAAVEKALKALPDEYVRRDYWKDAMDQMRDSLRRLEDRL